MDLAWEVIRRWRSKPERVGSLEGLARLLDLMSTLGRRACEVATERKEVTGPDGGPIRVEIEAALDMQRRSNAIIGLMHSYGYIGCMRAALAHLGFDCGAPRLPNLPLPAAQHDGFLAELEDAGFAELAGL